MEAVSTSSSLSQIEKEYNSVTSEDHRKKHAQFFTPFEISTFLARYILGGRREVTKILEPAFGLGIFSRVLRSEFGYANEISAFEVDSNIIKFGQKVCNKYDVDVINADYLSVWDLNPDGIICNPPYLKFHDYENLSAIKGINERLGTNLSGFTNLYALFILKSLSELPKDARAAYIVPSEFFNADYGVEVKRKLIQLNMLKHVVTFHFDENVFEGALTTSTLLLFENSSENSTVNFFNINTVDELNTISEVINEGRPADDLTHKFTYNLKELDPAVKWRNYYQETVVYNSGKLVNLKTFCKVSRGIATGANDYFSFNLSKARGYNIKADNLLNCITKSADIEKLFFTQEDFEQLAQEDRKVFLVDLRIWPDEHINSYIKLGEEIGADKKFLTKNRKPWYAIENKKPADIWVSVFNRDGIKFIQNNTNALNLTTFHGIYINSNYRHFKDIIFAYFLTDLSREIFNSNRREYGNGLSKFEPNDFNNSDVFDFRTLTEHDKTYLEEVIADLKVSQGDQVETDANITRLDEYFRGLL